MGSSGAWTMFAKTESPWKAAVGEGAIVWSLGFWDAMEEAESPTKWRARALILRSVGEEPWAPDIENCVPRMLAYWKGPNQTCAFRSRGKVMPFLAPFNCQMESSDDDVGVARCRRGARRGGWARVRGLLSSRSNDVGPSSVSRGSFWISRYGYGRSRSSCLETVDPEPQSGNHGHGLFAFRLWRISD